MREEEALKIVLELAKLGAEKESEYVDTSRVDDNYEAIEKVENYKNARATE